MCPERIRPPAEYMRSQQRGRLATSFAISLYTFSISFRIIQA